MPDTSFEPLPVPSAPLGQEPGWLPAPEAITPATAVEARKAIDKSEAAAEEFKSILPSEYWEKKKQLLDAGISVAAPVVGRLPVKVTGDDGVERDGFTQARYVDTTNNELHKLLFTFSDYLPKATDPRQLVEIVTEFEEIFKIDCKIFQESNSAVATAASFIAALDKKIGEFKNAYAEDTENLQKLVELNNRIEDKLLPIRLVVSERSERLILQGRLREWDNQLEQLSRLLNMIGRDPKEVEENLTFLGQLASQLIYRNGGDGTDAADRIIDKQ